jgi:hypothetical protein
MAQLPPVLVCGVAVLAELVLDEDERVAESSDEGESSSDDVDPLVVFDDVAAVAVFVLVVWLSLHAIAPPSERAVATLSAATARRARWARGLRRSIIGGLLGEGSRSGPTVRMPGKTAVSAGVEEIQKPGTEVEERWPSSDSRSRRGTS